jgi:hypothetical protein
VSGTEVLRNGFDPRTGRPLDREGEATKSLSDPELERELTLAAMDPRRRAARLAALLAERRRRRI